MAVPVSTWEPLNLLGLEPRPKIAPTVGGVGLVYPGKRHLFTGPPESAKTLASYAIMLEEVRRGGEALLLDFEMGPWDARERLIEMGATDEELLRIAYVEPEAQATENTAEELLSREAYSLVVIDAAAGAYSLQGLNDNDRGDVETFARIYLRPFWLQEIATIVIDHVGKNSERRGAFAIGSERKVGGIDVHLGFEVAVPLKRGGRGLYKITTHKDRLGHLERPKAGELEIKSDPLTHGLTWSFRPPESTGEGVAWRPTVLMERVSTWLEGQADAVSRNEVEKNVTGEARYVRTALDALIADGYVEETAGTRRSRPVRSIKPYRESTASDCVATASNGHGETALATASASRPLYRGDADEVVEENLFTPSKTA